MPNIIANILQFWYQYSSSPNYSLYISCGNYKENLSNNQELFESAKTFFIPMTLMFESEVILLGKIRRLSLFRG